jgi:hypothetical protein
VASSIKNTRVLKMLVGTVLKHLFSESDEDIHTVPKTHARTARAARAARAAALTATIRSSAHVSTRTSTAAAPPAANLTE